MIQNTKFNIDEIQALRDEGKSWLKISQQLGVEKWWTLKHWYDKTTKTLKKHLKPDNNTNFDYHAIQDMRRRKMTWKQIGSEYGVDWTKVHHFYDQTKKNPPTRKRTFHSFTAQQILEMRLSGMTWNTIVDEIGGSTTIYSLQRWFYKQPEYQEYLQSPIPRRRQTRYDAQEVLRMKQEGMMYGEIAKQFGASARYLRRWFLTTPEYQEFLQNNSFDNPINTNGGVMEGIRVDPEFCCRYCGKRISGRQNGGFCCTKCRAKFLAEHGLRWGDKIIGAVVPIETTDTIIKVMTNNVVQMNEGTNLILTIATRKKLQEGSNH